MKVQTYRDRDTTYRIEDHKLRESIHDRVAELFEGTDAIMRVFFDEKRRESIRQDEHFIEIFYDTLITLKSKKLGSYKVRKVLIPLTGDFAGNEESPVVTLLIGDEKYLSNPFRNMSGRPALMQLDSLLSQLTKEKKENHLKNK